MKWFTPAFAGEMDLGECRRVVEEYQVHLAAILRGAPREIREFANAASLHDSLVWRFSAGPDAVEMSVRVESRLLDMEFRNARAIPAVLRGDMEILYEELDRMADAYEIRLLMGDLSEMSIIFDSLRWMLRPDA
ncbi:hypothetical protein C1I98_29250 [Spongiactinospora gelatinilytica]|uniref:Uncharacterized protein n=1 Tax=Spongiactinospora gelatinilytica TaxID=2666298 RepID=A0A2W2H0D7_9ACTN|nr:hypothetical protein [Spongiactinospora gelatinilytica]PZG32524.1 hypothetical protein C1I98_29250 [Spongiactinospora gelatinilytica]